MSRQTAHWDGETRQQQHKRDEPAAMGDTDEIRPPVRIEVTAQWLAKQEAKQPAI
jgi:hypothetical protein